MKLFELRPFRASSMQITPGTREAQKPGPQPPSTATVESPTKTILSFWVAGCFISDRDGGTAIPSVLATNRMDMGNFISIFASLLLPHCVAFIGPVGLVRRYVAAASVKLMNQVLPATKRMIFTESRMLHRSIHVCYLAAGEGV